MSDPTNDLFSIRGQGNIRLKAESPIGMRFVPCSRMLASVNKGTYGQDRDKFCALPDSVTSSGENMAIFKADDGGVLDVRRLRITQKMAILSRFEAYVPLSTDAIVPSYKRDQP
ncbi:MAG: hypothetical protein Q4D90_06070 [bacterium]|nr:hypothetical protein [bacterium]